MRAHLMNIREDRNNHIDDIILELMLEHETLANKILTYISEQGKSAYLNILKNPSELFNNEELKDNNVKKILELLQHYQSLLINESSEIQNAIQKKRIEVSKVIDGEILQKQKELDKLLKQQRKYSNKLQKLIHTVEQLDYNIFPPSKSGSTVGQSNEENKNNFIKTSNKFEQICIILEELKIKISYPIGIEDVTKNKNREYPYKIIKLKDIGKTIVVSDQIGEATFIYDGVIDFIYLKDNHKQKESNEVKFSRISFSDDYQKNIKECLIHQEKYGYSCNIVHRSIESSTSKEYFANVSFEEFQADLKTIKSFTTMNTRENINGINFKRIVRGYLNYKLNIPINKQNGYSGITVKLLEKVSLGEINNFQELEEKFKQQKVIINKNKANKFTSKEYFENIVFSDFQEDLKNIISFKTTNNVDTIRGLSFGQIIYGYLNYKLSYPKNQRASYLSLMIQLLKEVKEGTINSFEELNAKFQKQKIVIDQHNKIKVIPKQYFDEISFEQFKRDLGNITSFTINNREPEIKGSLNLQQIKSGYIKHKLGITQGYSSYGSVTVQLFKKVRDGIINSFEELQEQFLEQKMIIDEFNKTRMKPQQYFDEISFEQFQKDLGNITSFTTNNTKEYISSGLNLLQIYRGYLNYKLGIDTEKGGKYGSAIVLILKDVSIGKIYSFEELNTKIKKRIQEIDSTISPSNYFTDIDFMQFQKDLSYITSFSLSNENINTIYFKGLTFRQIYSGYLRHKLGVRNETHGALIASLLEKTKNGDFKSFKEIEDKYIESIKALDIEN